MTLVRRLSVAALAFTYLQLVFGGVVRITGSGMGCGDHWPKCNGSWIPPFTNPTVMIEWTHRLLALLVVLSILALVVAARRSGAAEAGRVRGPGELALGLVVTVALLGMITVKLGNTAMATVAHWTLAMALLGVLIAAAMRTGALGADAARLQGGTPRAVRSLSAGAALALAAVVLGGLVAKVPGAAAACPNFPTCGDTPADIGRGARDVQVAHRLVAFLLLFHSAAIATAIRRRQNEAEATRRAAAIAAGLVVAQAGLGAAMLLAGFPILLRVAHQAIGVAVWMTMFGAAYLARSSAGARA